MRRREFFKSSLAMSTFGLGGRPFLALPSPAEEFPKSPGLTKYVAMVTSCSQPKLFSVIEKHNQTPSQGLRRTSTASSSHLHMPG